MTCKAKVDMIENRICTGLSPRLSQVRGFQFFGLMTLPVLCALQRLTAPSPGWSLHHPSHLYSYQAGHRWQ